MLIGYFTEQPYTMYPEEERFRHRPGDHPARHDETILLFSNKFYNPVDASRLYNERLVEYRLAEEVGFDAIMTNEHHGGPYCMQIRCNITTTAIAAQTERVRLLQLGNPLPLWDNPVLAAEEIAMIDLISKGRLVAGIVRGGGQEQIAVNVNPVYNKARFREAHDLMIKAWTEPGPWRWEGEHYDVRVVNPWARPLQQPHPRIFVPGSLSPDTVTFAAEHAYPFVSLSAGLERTMAIWNIYDEEAERQGYTPGPQHRGYLMRCHVQRDEDHAKKNAEQFDWMLGEFTGISNPVWNTPTGYSSLAARKARLVRQGTKTTIDERIAQHSIVAGNPKQVIEGIRYWLEETRPGILILLANDGRVSHEDSLSCIRLLGEEVLPAVRDIAKDLELEGPFEVNGPVSLADATQSGRVI
jgi:alkanesulfonate monooxygenase SsuD/methylene tetrahydromethanopterin reductase-like flavin-dependent oxidoreductase (luciferase family)